MPRRLKDQPRKKGPQARHGKATYQVLLILCIECRVECGRFATLSFDKSIPY